MATIAGLVRSYYGWLVRKERALKESGNEVYQRLLPAQRPTSLSAVTRIALHSARVLKDTEYEDRALYWARLFERIRQEGWQGEIRPMDDCRAQIRAELQEALGDLAVQSLR
jgi:hypothetical protein